VRSKSIIKTILERRRERVEAGMMAYDLVGNQNGVRTYDPSLGVNNLPLAHYSGLRIASPIARIGRESVGHEEGGNEGYGVGVINERYEKGLRKEDLGGDVRVQRGAYWGDFYTGYGGENGDGEAVGGDGSEGGGGDGGGGGREVYSDM